ncbi:type VII toxin-antitoxin system HepT family RNase toxin [Vulcanisaeta souniana]|uniref:Polymerase beta nucleotidyltransferase domain-containing protein n=1 Tax=Vulcanisaeta souniana JCM 11219 TaxID=1293586 RepID=A0A830EE26_9CREN|nr:HepT-like ribonuclease domain-containing protein [Vulcanisaeta souniana]BDR92096.1 hypothetical protein Vsou_11890 [Vulcanisaeta souniana JCM 11219]GGI67895.1 hypothetical protein GCM10007112_01190 [Vulcanisaeta souniana JCM 11219]
MMVMRLRRILDSLSRYFDEFRAMRRGGGSIYAVERLTQLTIQALLDLGAMLAVELRDRKPETYRDIADYLSNKLGLDEDLRKFLRGLAGFRNVLVHGYAEINRELEEEAFRDMEERLPLIIERLRNFISGTGDSGQMDIEELRARLKPVFERHGVRFALLFGSRARAGVGRDYDIAISADLRSAIELGELIVDIAETLGVNEDLIDVVHLESAGAGILYSVINDGVVIHGDEEEAMNYLWRRYLELLNINEYLNHLERHMSP